MAYGIGGYKDALASCKFRGAFDTDSASLSIVERISEVLPVEGMYELETTASKLRRSLRRQFPP